MKSSKRTDTGSMKASHASSTSFHESGREHIRLNSAKYSSVEENSPLMVFIQNLVGLCQTEATESLDCAGVVELDDDAAEVEY